MLFQGCISFNELFQVIKDTFIQRLKLVLADRQVRQREREREREREWEREIERGREIVKGSEIVRGREREIERGRETEIERKTETLTETHSSRTFSLRFSSIVYG